MIVSEGWDFVNRKTKESLYTKNTKNSMLLFTSIISLTLKLSYDRIQLLVRGLAIKLDC